MRPELAEISTLARNVASDPLTLAQYSTAACMYQITPSVVVFPESEEEVARVVRHARETGIPVTARGGGSSLVGQALGSGVILDFSRFMRNVLDTDVARRSVRVQPGITLGALNRHLASSGLVFPPDPSSGDYATLGGMIACNSSGARSVKYGSTIDYVESLRCVLADGSVLEFKGSEVTPVTSEAALAKNIRDVVPELLRRSAGAINDGFPRCPKNSSGYQLAKAFTPDGVDFARLLVGSEGTLGIVTAASLRVLPRPTASSMVLLNFASVSDAGEAVQRLLPFGPSAVEIMDRTALDLIRVNRPELTPFLPAGVDAQLFVEFDGDGKEAIESACEAAVREAGRLSTGHVFAFDGPTHAALMNVRKATLPILYTLPGQKRPVAFVEDVIVPPESLGEFIVGLKTLFATHGVEAAIYGHAGQGNLHVRPLLDLTDGNDVAKIRRLADDVFQLVKSFRGSVSGEHGDGRARAPYLREMFGELADVFLELRRTFDPTAILNPGVKVWAQPDQIDANLRLGEGFSLRPLPTTLPVSQEEIAKIISLCHGCGNCRIPDPPVTMCPVYKASGEERATPRAKANLLRLFASGQLPDSLRHSNEWKQVLDTCIGCRMCSFECPSGVDIGRVMMVARAAYAGEAGRSMTERMLGSSDYLSRLGSAFAPIANVFAGQRAIRAGLDFVAGLDSHRAPMRFSRRTFSSWFAREGRPAQSKERVVYFPDQWAQYHDPDVGKAFCSIMSKLGVEVVVPPTLPCGIAASANGDLKTMRRLARRNVRVLRPYAEEGLQILATEPTATLFLKDEYRDIVGEHEAESVAARMQDACAFIERRLREGCELPLREMKLHVAYHAPCHLKAMRIGRPAVDLLRRIPGLRVSVLEEGCCGMAGTFGMKSQHFGMSMAIGKRLLERVGEPSVDFGVTDCSTCKLQMETGRTKKTVHPLKMLAVAMGTAMELH